MVSHLAYGKHDSSKIVIAKTLNKKGFIRIAELLIAITLISIILIIAYKQRLPSQETQDFSELARSILSEVSANEDLRVEIINNQQNASMMIKTINFINNSLADYISFELRACSVSSACGQSSYVGDVYSAERIISASKNNFNPIKLRLFLWLNQQ